jgi:hypothetical protein
MSTAFKVFRAGLLLSILIWLLFYTKMQKIKSRSWSTPLEVVIYPMNSEHSPIVDRYIDQLSHATFEEINQFFSQQAKDHGLFIKNPIKVQLGSSIADVPPPTPDPSAHFIKIAWWSVQFRYWAYVHTPDDKSNLHRVRVFVNYHEAQENTRLKHSLGLDNGLLSIVHAFALTDQNQQNNIVVAHELLHTVGATDKYSADNQPVYPDGYANPTKQPLFPQFRAEIMSGKIPSSRMQSTMAESLQYCVINEKTAKEINWITVTQSD